MNRLKPFLLLLMLCLALWLPANSYAQREHDPSGCISDPLPPVAEAPKFEHLTTEQGLSNNRVVSILQDRRGFMWFGTFDGLNRYDGYEFKIFRHVIGDENSLSANVILALHEDQDGALWIGTSGGGLNRYDPKSEHFTRYRHDPDDPHSLGSDTVFAIYEDRDGELWIGTGGGGLNRYDPQIEGFVRYQHDLENLHSLSDNTVRAIFEDREGVLWIGTEGGGLNWFDRQTEQFTSYRHDSGDPNSLGDDSVATILQDSTGAVWIGFLSGGLDRLERVTEDADTTRFTHYRHDPENPFSLSHDVVTSLYNDASGGLWVGTGGGGLNRFDCQTEEFIRYKPNPDDPYSLSHVNVQVVYGDPTGLLWIGSTGGGVDKLDLTPKPFTHYRNIPGNLNSLSSNDVLGIYEGGEGVLWIATGGGGLNRYDPLTNKFTRYMHDSNDPNSLSHNLVREVVQDQEGMLWLATRGGVNRFDPQTEQFTKYLHDPADPYSLSSDNVMTVYNDQTGVLWIGTWVGLNSLDPRTGEISSYHLDPNDPHNKSDFTVIAIYQDQARVLWLGTFGDGLIQFNPETDAITHYQQDDKDIHSLSDNTIFTIFEDSAGSLWLGTSTGLDRFDRDSGQFIHYGEKDGLPAAGVLGILEEYNPIEQDGKNLWISTSRGLSNFNPQSGTVRNYDVTDGLQGDEFSWGSAFKSESGELFFGGTNGLTAFYPSQIVDNPHIPPVLFTDFQLDNVPAEIGDESILKQSISETDQLSLSYQDRVISFEFAALDYRAPEKNRYRYMLEGFDEDWTEVGGDRRFVTYTNLDPDEYVFRVLGSNNDGAWNVDGASIKITVTPAWWQTWWFRGALLALAAALMLGGYRWREKNVEARSRDLERQVAEQTHELGERVKELNCLYGISRLAGRQGISLTEILQVTVDLIPLTWQYPEFTCARIILDGQEYKTDNFEETPYMQKEGIIVRGERAGSVDVCYLTGDLKSAEEPFLEEEKNLLSVIAERLGRITERKQAEDALSKRVEELAMLNQIAHTVSSVTELPAALHTVAGTVTKNFDCAITLVTILENDHMKVLAQFEREQGTADMVGKTLPLLIMPEIRQVIEAGESRVVSDIQAFSLPAAIDTVFRVRNIRALMVVPLLVRGAAIGALFVGCDRPGREYSSTEVNLVEIIATDIAGAIENARLYDQAQDVAVDSERQRLARELHDSVTQSLYTTSLIAEALPSVWQSHPDEALRSLEELRKINQGALAEMRALLMELRPDALVERPLGELLGQLTEAMSARTNLPITTSMTGNCQLPAEVQVALYRITQESLNNISKHARASRAWVNVRCSPSGATLRIRDNGRGFDPGAASPHQLGLRIMHERTQTIGAELTINSQPDQGTEILVEWHENKLE